MVLRNAGLILGTFLGGQCIAFGLAQIYAPLYLIASGCTTLGTCWVYSVITRPKGIR